MGSFLPNKLFDIKGFLVVLGNDVNNLSNFHVLIVESASVLLNSQSVALTVFVNSLLDCKLLNLAIFLLDIMPDFI